MKLHIWVFFENLWRKFKFHRNRTRITCTLREDQYTYLIISSSVLLRMRNISNKICKEKQNTRFVFNNFFFFENPAVCEIMWKNFVRPGRPQMTIWGMRIACWIPKTTNTLRIRNTYCFSTAIMAVRKRLGVMVHCLSYTTFRKW